MSWFKRPQISGWLACVSLLVARALVAESRASDSATFAVQAYQLQGNTLLDEQELRPLFTNAVGAAVTLDQVFKVLANVHRTYLEHGFAGVMVSIPQQELTNGLVVIQVTEPLSARTMAASAKLPARKSSVPAPFEVRAYEVAGNTLLSPATVQAIFTNATGKTVTLEQLQKAAGELQLAYRERGFATVSVSVPPQRITNAVVKVIVTEGTLAVIKVTGNRYFSSNNIARALPGLRTNVLLNGILFQRELDLANADRDRRIYPTLSPGPDPGTSALELNVKDRLPLHAHFDVDNYSTPGTPDLRLNFAAQYENLWQLEHQIGLSYGFSPEQFKSGVGVSDYFFNRPLIAYYGAYYRMPLGAVQSLQAESNNFSSFGYDEATHQVRQPAVSGRPDLTIYANVASSDTGVQYGPSALVNSTATQTIISQDTGQNLTVNQVLGARLNIPFAVTEAIQLGFSGGADIKRYSLNGFNTNNFLLTTIFVTNGSSVTAPVSQAQPATSVEVGYLPLNVGVDFAEKDAWGNVALNLNGSYNLVGSSADFSRAGYSTKGGASFAKLNFSFTREQVVYRDWTILLRAAGQASPNELINNEQFAVGGINSVRGYYEGETYGDSGWSAGVEARTPYLKTPVAVFSGSVPAWVRGSVFADYGQRFLNDSSATLKSTESLLGVGFGLSANLNNYLEMRLAVGWPLEQTAYSRVGSARANFSLGGQF